MAVEQDLDALGVLAARCGWLRLRLDTAGATDRTSFHEAARRSLGLPEWTGRNLDAFDEALRDLVDAEVTPGVLMSWTGWRDLASGDPQRYAAVLDVLVDVRRSWHDDGVDAALVLEV